MMHQVNLTLGWMEGGVFIHQTICGMQQYFSSLIRFKKKMWLKASYNSLDFFYMILKLIEIF